MTGPQQQQRSVSFAEDRNETFEFDYEFDYMAMNKHNLFFTAAEYAQIKSRMRREASRIKRQVEHLLRDSFDLNSVVAQGMLNTFAQFQPADDDNNNNDEDCSGRGLERYLSRRFARDRTEIKDFCLFTVLTKQRKLRRMGLSYSSSSNDEIMSDSIAADYQEQSEQARLFARRIAVADELVVHGDSIATTAAQQAGSKRHYGNMLRSSSSSDSLSSTESDSFSDNDSLSTASLLCRGGPAAKIPRCPSSPVSAAEELAQTAMDVDME